MMGKWEIINGKEVVWELQAKYDDIDKRLPFYALLNELEGGKKRWPTRIFKQAGPELRKALRNAAMMGLAKRL